MSTTKSGQFDQCQNLALQPTELAECQTPFTVMDKLRGSIPVPCGKCPNCLARRVSGWSFRLMQEDKIALSAHFITLTYDTKHVPITRNGFMSLSKRDLQLFFKRLRKVSPRGLKIKYYAAGEYGGNTRRPHYHIILFNAKLEKIQPAWDLGNVHYGVVSAASVGYTLKYISKPAKIPLHSNDDRLREFALMSKGLGENYLTEQMVNWHHDDLDNRMYVNLEGGKKASMPRYYKEKVYTELERKRIGYLAREKMLEAEKDKGKLMPVMVDDTERWVSNPDYHAKKAERDKASFRKEAIKSQQRDKQ